jgi:hypothetical protein
MHQAGIDLNSVQWAEHTDPHLFQEHPMAYSDKVIDHYENPRNVGGFETADEGVGTGMVGAPACGDVMKLQIKVNRPPA